MAESIKFVTIDGASCAGVVTGVHKKQKKAGKTVPMESSMGTMKRIFVETRKRVLHNFCTKKGCTNAFGCATWRKSAKKAKKFDFFAHLSYNLTMLYDGIVYLSFRQRIAQKNQKGKDHKNDF